MKKQTEKQTPHTFEPSVTYKKIGDYCTCGLRVDNPIHAKEKLEEIVYEKIFCIREGNQWAAGAYHSGLAQELLVKDKNQSMALAKLANKLYLKL